MKPKLILFTDIDGTLLNNEKKISEKNLIALKNNPNFIRVAITGRNLISAKRVLPPSLAIDFLIFSNGAGIINWKSQQIIYKQNLNKNITKQISQFLINKKVTFTIHKPIPQTHYYSYHIGHYLPSDLILRNNYYKQFITPLKNIEEITDSTCIICMLSNKEQDFYKLKESLKLFQKQISITRTTSPFNHKNIWLEIYNHKVNKGKTAKFLCHLLSINTANTIGIGNDYNDISLLEFVKFPFVVENAPDKLKKQYYLTNDHNNHAIAHVIDLFNKKT